MSLPTTEEGLTDYCREGEATLSRVLSARTAVIEDMAATDNARFDDKTDALFHDCSSDVLTFTHILERESVAFGFAHAIFGTEGMPSMDSLYIGAQCEYAFRLAKVFVNLTTTGKADLCAFLELCAVAAVRYAREREPHPDLTPHE